MGISDYIWPFEKKFSSILCGREAAIAALAGGPALGAATIIRFGHGRYAFKTSVNGGFVIFWLAFIACRYQQKSVKNMSESFVEAYKSGDVD